MIAKIVREDPTPPPPTRVVLEMTKEDAEILLDIVNTDVSVPEAVRSFTCRPAGDTARFCCRAADALYRAGVAS